jgi:hypothetical protein
MSQGPAAAVERGEATRRAVSMMITTAVVVMAMSCCRLAGGISLE